MIQTYLSRWSLSGATSSNRGSHPLIGQHAQLNAGTQAVRMPIGGSISNFFVYSEVAFSSGTNQVGLYINGSLSSLSGTIQTGTQSFLVAGPVAITAGQTLEIRANYSGAPMPHALRISFDFDNGTVGTSVYGWGGALANGNNSWDGLIYSGGLQAWNSVVDGVRNTVSLTGNFTQLNVNIGLAPGAGNTRTWVIYKNYIAQDGTGGTPDTRVTLTGSGTGSGITFGSTNFTLPVAPQDIVFVGHTVTGTPTTFNVQVTGTSVFEGPADSYMMGQASNGGPSGGADNYQLPFGNTIGFFYSGSDAAKLMTNGSSPIPLTNFWVQVDHAPGLGSSWIFTLLVDGVDTDLSVTISGNETIGFDSGNVTIGTNQVATVRISPVGSPVSANETNWAFTVGEPAEPPNPDDCQCLPPGTPGTPGTQPPDDEILIPDQELCDCGGIVPEQAYSPFVEVWWGIGQ